MSKNMDASRNAEPYVAYREPNPLVKSKPWAFVSLTHPDSERGRQGITRVLHSGYSTKKRAQEMADVERRIAELDGLI